MHLRSNVAALILAAAAGAAAMRGWAASHSAAQARSPATTFVASGDGEGAAVLGSGRRAAVASGGASEHARGGAPVRRTAAGPAARAVVYMVGAVIKPGVYALAADARIVDALHAAGGPSAGADLVAIDLAQHVEDGIEIAVPVHGATAVRDRQGISGGFEEPRAQTSKHSRHRKRPRRGRTPGADESATLADAPTDSVDINSADAATLATLPGIGPSLAARLIAFRDLNGPFASTDELLDVGGMTPGKVDALAPYVRF